MSERPKEADCKSAGLRLRRFKSFSRHHAVCVDNPAPLAQSVERFHGKEEVFGSTPEGGSAADEVSRWGLAVPISCLQARSAGTRERLRQAEKLRRSFLKAETKFQAA